MFILVAILFIISCSSAFVVAGKLGVMCDRFKDSRNVWSSSQARDNPQRVRNNRWSYQQFRLFCVQFLQNNKRKETSLLISGQFQLNKHWPGHPLVCLETPLKSAFATRKYILVVMISLVVDKKNPKSCFQTCVNPTSGLQSNPISRLDCPLPNPQKYFGQIPDPENTLPNSGGPESTLNTPSQSLCWKEKSNAPSPEQVYTINPPPGEWISSQIPSCFPHSQTPPHEVYIERCSKCFKSSDNFFCCGFVARQLGDRNPMYF